MLENRRIAGAALDVFNQEPLPADHPLRRVENTILTPHIGYLTDGTFEAYVAPASLRVRSMLNTLFIATSIVGLRVIRPLSAFFGHSR